MPNTEAIIEKLNAARNGLNTARNAAYAWQQGNVAGVTLTNNQRAALKTSLLAGIQAGKDGIVAVEQELAKT